MLLDTLCSGIMGLRFWVSFFQFSAGLSWVFLPDQMVCSQFRILRRNSVERVCVTSFKSTAKGSFMYCYKNRYLFSSCTWSIKPDSSSN